MFLTLVRKECMQHLKSVIYYIFILYLAFDFVIQLGRFETVPKPEPGQNDYSYYGEQETDDEMIIMQKNLEELLQEYDEGKFVTYPFGFYKSITPSEAEIGEIQELICDMTGMTKKEIEAAHEAYNKELQELIPKLIDEKGPILEEGDIPKFTLPVRADYPYDTFLKKMKWLDKLLGGGSHYSEDNIVENALQSVGYEVAAKMYDDFINKDKVTSAYARLFCDYEGITLAFFTIFLAVARALRDRRAQVEQVVYAKRASSAKLVLSRYLAGVIMTLIPVFLLNCVLIVQAIYFAKHLGVAVDYFAGVRYIGFWLIPTILVTLAVGFFLTELTDSVIAIPVQFAWWYITISSYPFVETAKFTLIPRFNALIGYEFYESMRPALLWNRGFYTVLAAVILLLTIIVYEKKRKGVFVSVGTMLRNRKNKLEA